MSFFDQAKNLTGDLLAEGKRQTRRAKLARDLRKLESKLEAEHAALGRALLPLLETGVLSVDIPEVAQHRKAAADLRAEIASKQRQIDSHSATPTTERHPSQVESIQNIDHNARPEAAADQSAKDIASEQKGDAAEEGGEG